MGTSTGYNAPTSPQWRQAKTQVTQAARRGRPTRGLARSVISSYISANGGARGLASGGGVAGGSRAARNVAGNIAGFVTSVGTQGFRETLRMVGLGSLEGKSVEEIICSLADYLGGPANTANDADLRKAILDLTDELLSEAEGFDDVEKIMEELSQKGNLNKLLIKFFGYYLYEQFCRVFYERLVERVGESNADQFIGGIREYIVSALERDTSNLDISRIDWSGEQGKEIAERILQETLEVFAG